MDTLLLFARTLLALGVVLGLVWGLSRLSRRAQNGGLRRRPTRSRTAGDTGPDQRLTVVTRRSLSRSSGIVVVRVGERNLLLGTTAQSVTLLTELDPQDSPTGRDTLSASGDAANDTPWKATSGQQPLAWDAIISTLRDKTTRH